jgi:hypothetical protein
MKRESATAIFRNGAGIKVQFDAHLLTIYFLFFGLNSWAYASPVHARGCVKRSKNQRKKRGHNDLCGSETKKQVTSAYAGKGRKS